MTIRVVPLSIGRRVAYALAYGAVLTLLAWLDAHCGLRVHGDPLPLHTAHVFTLIIAGIQALASWLATAATVTVTYLAQVVAWLGTRVGHILKSTGALFAKSWDALKIVWSDVLKPALVWVDQQLTRLHDWLKRTFKPVFEWLRIAREHVQDLYKRFVRPVIDTIEFIRAINRVLLTFHVTVLQELDKVLAALERRITEPILWILSVLNRVQDVLDRIVAFDGLFQRLTLIRSLGKYAPDWLRIAWNAQAHPLTAEEQKKHREAVEATPVSKHVSEFHGYTQGDGGKLGARVSELVAQFQIDLKHAR